MNKPFYLLFVCVSLSFTGCVSWSKHNVLLEPPRKMRIAVLPAEVTVKINKLKNIRSIPPGNLLADEQVLIRKELNKVTEEINTSLERSLNNSYLFEAVSKQDVDLALSSLGIDTPASSLSAVQIKKLGKLLGVQAVMSVKLSGYGKIKKQWQVLLVCSGIAEGLIQGVLVKEALENESLALLVGGEEIIQEFITWVGGIYIFNNIFSPVILESKLASTSDGKVFWSKTSFSTIDRKAIKKYSKEEQKLKELRLKVTGETAVREILKALQEKAMNNVQ